MRINAEIRKSAHYSAIIRVFWLILVVVFFLFCFCNLTSAYKHIYSQTPCAASWCTKGVGM